MAPQEIQERIIQECHGGQLSGYFATECTEHLLHVGGGVVLNIRKLNSDSE